MINPFKKYKEFKQDIFSDQMMQEASEETKKQIIKARKRMLAIDMFKFFMFLVAAFIVGSFLIYSMSRFASWLINLF